MRLLRPRERATPLGKGGASICFDCAMSTPENETEAKRRLADRLDGREPGGES